MELRCKAKKHAELLDGVLEVKCNSKFCGAATGIVVIHQFDALTGELLDTKQFRDPKEVKHGATRSSDSVWA